MSYMERKGNIFDADDLDGLAHGVNCQGVMGAGIAKDFRLRWPVMYKGYRSLAEEGSLYPGKVFPYQSPEGRTIYNLCSQDRPGPDAKLRWVAQSVATMLDYAEDNQVRRIGIPRIGCGIGGLEWIDVRLILELLANESSVDLVAFSL